MNMTSVVAVVWRQDNRVVDRAVKAFEFRAGQVVALLENGCEMAADRLLGVRVDGLLLKWSQSAGRFVPVG